ncbi:uncharacterized protein LOC111023978 [Momordica charantia]|uniref:Uncharacterized protein LOC111023978 n=1 Tax=Momordica charantia TaxID=3673 RepID=A0A6J1DXB4_MOMCH|nr:uncharacterized protein LOC111023978 [Momordica charantia]
MRHLEQVVPEIREELQEIGYEKWARAFSTKNRHGLMTTNISESINSTFSEARELPVICLLQNIRDLMQRWFYERRSFYSYQQIDITPWTANALRSSLKESRTMDIYPVDQYLYDVHNDDRHFNVNILHCTCNFKQWDIDFIPCSHACLAISRRGLELHSFVHKFYHVKTLQLLYSWNVHPIGQIENILPPVQPDDTGILPPNVKRSAGRPRKKRLISRVEATNTVRCGRCHKLGHNRRRCKNPPAT